MKLADLATGPDWIIWIVFVVFAVLSIILLSGHGSWFISGYNMASKEEKEKYDEKKLCRTTGIGMSIIAILILILNYSRLCRESGRKPHNYCILTAHCFSSIK